MKRQAKHISQQQAQEQQQALEGQQSTQQTVREFGTPEELLRHDAMHTPVPPSIAHRLQASIGPAAPPAPWWRRLFGS